MLWKKLTHEDLKLDLEQWGWKLDGTTLSPVMTDMAAAPDTLLKFGLLLGIHVEPLATKLVSSVLRRL